MNTTTAKVQKTGDANVFTVLINGEVIATLRKSTQNVAAKQGNARMGYKMKTVWGYQITAAGVPLNRQFGSGINNRKNAVDMITETITAASRPLSY